MKERLKAMLTERQQRRIRNFRKRLRAFFVRGNLIKLATIFGTDKWGGHWYAQHYDTHFKKLRRKKINILEIGVGGYDDPSQGGNSLRTWKSYFTRANIFGLDLFDKSLLEEKRIKIFKGSQVDEAFLKNVVAATGPLDIIIDDGSHINEHIITSFKILFPALKQDGIYVVEDLETSYWPSYGGDSKDLKQSPTAINYFKGLVDSLNHMEYILPEYEPSYLDLNITAIYFYHNMAFIQKGKNIEKSVNIIDNKHHRLDSEK